MHTTIIADGLTREFLSSELPYRDSRKNVGRLEIERLMGKGRSLGDGPLPVLLGRAVEARTGGSPIDVLLLGGTAPGSDEAAIEQFAEPFHEIARQASILQMSDDATSCRALAQYLQAAHGDRALSPDARFLVVGCHTDRRILAICSFLRNVLGCERVAVGPHWVGSSTPAAHFAALRHNFPGLGVDILLDVQQVAEFAGFEPPTRGAQSWGPCQLSYLEGTAELAARERRIVELLCLQWSKAGLRTLTGGMSGSLLLLADGFKGSARTEPMVLKIDRFSQMRRELDGYHLVKDLFGKHVPTFDYPVSDGDLVGVGMELAAMEGRPLTLQDTFEAADDEESLQRFWRRLDKALGLLSEKLYRNTLETAATVPYRVFGLHAQNEHDWLLENSQLALSYLEPAARQLAPKPARLAKLLKVLARNEDGIESETCLVHGDMNYANVICDEGDNIWFIDWTHSGRYPVEIDFAKLENDVKFVMSKELEVEDLPRMKRLEEYLAEHRLPGDANSLPSNLKFIKWDLRFSRILGTVRRIREACFALKETDDWLVYRVALLRYALHTLSFDKRRGRGECEPVALLHALFSAESLMSVLVADDYNLRIRSDRPASYPPRQRISIDESPWLFDCPEYDPPYYVDPTVLENDRTKKTGGWADPEDVTLVADVPRVRDAAHHDERGRPCNPRGRTGIAGRGLLGLWGANVAVAVTVVRRNEVTGELDVLLGSKTKGRGPDLPKGFVLPSEEFDAAVRRVLIDETGWPAPTPGEAVFQGYTYDLRQTDHAWAECRVHLILAEGEVRRAPLRPGGEFEEVQWWPLDAATVNSMPSGQSRFIREAIKKLVELGQVDAQSAEGLLSATG